MISSPLWIDCESQQRNNSSPSFHNTTIKSNLWKDCQDLSSTQKWLRRFSRDICIRMTHPLQSLSTVIMTSL